ncbi:MAG: NAD+ synthase [Patescibacteria group bacterium]
MKKNYKQIEGKITKFLKERIGDREAILGLSGGLDSAVVAYLAVKALGHKKILAISTPSKSNSREDLNYAKLVSKDLTIRHRGIKIESIIKSFKKNTPLFRDRLSAGNLTARVRMCILYGAANETGGMVLGTGNKTELLIGYFTKYGDGATDILPIGDLYKTEVIGLAKYLGVPKKIISRPPTAGLWLGQEDEKELGIAYRELDKILEAMEQKEDLSKFTQARILKVEKMIDKNLHKLQTPPICKI